MCEDVLGAGAVLNLEVGGMGINGIPLCRKVKEKEQLFIIGR